MRMEGNLEKETIEEVRVWSCSRRIGGSERKYKKCLRTEGAPQGGNHVTGE